MAASDTIIDGSFPGVERRYGVVVFSGGYPLAGLTFLIMFLLLIALTAIVPQALRRFHVPGVVSILLIAKGNIQFDEIQDIQPEAIAEIEMEEELA